MQALNTTLFQWMAAGHSPNPQLLWLAATIAVGSSWLCVAVMGWMAWRHPAQRTYVAATLATAAATTLLAHAIAGAINVPRPFVAGLSPSYINHAARGSLPSAHATVMFTIALIACMRPALRVAGIALLAIALVTGWARIYVGVHYPLDVASGFLLAAAITGVFWLLLKVRPTIHPASPD
ncbi:phosphatase PAP2 family protein [Variovorax sp. YR216]|uniref:phosphatase PAP2 family protein n=1 Tax=Variovorax sp. YR216 TaxID=1882828 RepID=UPI00089B6F31|nr:phosphatase PAP2 family protein [Variovorax sp. YR216]SEA00202.1 Undecaprenyl-diphosphatase [Variovorax sp. YR216]